MLHADNVSKRFGSISALSNVGFRVGPGEIVAISGENGAGKSTLVKCIAGALNPDSGTIHVDGEKLGKSPHDAMDRGISVVWQDLALCENLDVTSNLFLGREVGRGGALRASEMSRLAQKAFANLGVIIPDLDRPIERLAGGQRQLVAIARATLDLPKVLILDEPTAALGIAEGRTVLDVIRKLQAQGVAILFVSHQLDQVFDLADRIIVLRHGRLVADLHRTETHPDDVVALITGADVDTTASQQLRRLHSLSEQLADAEQSSILPLTVSSLSGALDCERLAIFLSKDTPTGQVLRCSANLHLPRGLLDQLSEIPVGPDGGFLAQAALHNSLVVIPHLRELNDDPVADLALASHLAGAWAAPIAGRNGSLAMIVGFTDTVAQLQPDQIQLLELFSTMAGAAFERGQLVEVLRDQNNTLEGLREILEALAGPDLPRNGVASALDAVCRGAHCSFASLLVGADDGSLVEHSASTLRDPDDVQRARSAIELSLADRTDGPDTIIIRFDWSQGRGALACHWGGEAGPGLGVLIMREAASSFRLALERELAVEAIHESESLQRSRAVERALTRRLGHELRTPLTAIQGFSSTMLQPDVEWPAHDKHRFLQIIESEAGRMNRLVDQLFDDSAIESGTLNLDSDFCDLTTIIANAMSVAVSDGCATANVPDRLEIWADQDRLQQVFVNLIGNAVRHNPPNTKIHIGVEAPDSPDGTVRIVVRDDGDGLPSDVVEFINGKRDQFAKDRGLGIRLARGFVRAHGGRIGVESGEAGCEFRIELPASPGAS